MKLLGACISRSSGPLVPRVEMQKQRWSLELRICRSSGEAEFWNFQIHLQASKLNFKAIKLILLGKKLEETKQNTWKWFKHDEFKIIAPNQGLKACQLTEMKLKSWKI